jgi:uncharacterized membrane protein YoaK (UPF0700 family)
MLASADPDRTSRQSGLRRPAHDEIGAVTSAQDPAAVDRRLGVLVGLLALTAGATDAVSFLALGGVFSSVMTANLVLLGLSAGLHSGALAAHSAVAFAGYVTGALAASGLLRSRSQDAAALGAELLVLIGFTAAWELTSGRPTGASQLALLACAALAMGGQSATVFSLRIPGISTTYMAGMLTGILGDLATSGRHGLGYRLALLGLLIAGAVASGITYAQAPRLVPLILLAPLLATIIISGWQTTNQPPGMP